MKRFLITVATLGLTASGALAYGQSTIDANQAVQSQRIEEGRLNGSLTKREYRDLKAEQGKIHEMESRAKANGSVSKREYERIHDAQLRAYGDIKDDSGNRKVNYLRKWLSNHR